MFEKLSLREKVCRLVMVQINPDKHKKQFGSIEAFFEQYPVGAVFAGAEIIRDAKNSKEQVREAIAQYRDASKLPLLVAADGEHGFGGVATGCTVFPNQMSVGTARSEELAYDFAKAAAIEGRQLGFNWNFAPVCDLNINRHNRITNCRSLTDDPELARRLIRQIVKGYQENGLIATGKHFPGDGIDHRNQHLMPTCNSLPMDEWHKKSGAVFKAAIDAGIGAMMIGHISLPAYQGDAIKGHYPPGTLSADIITKLLKEEMGFSGVAISDALDMGGFTRWYYERDEAEIRSFEAGMDMLLWPRLETIDEITRRLERGDIPMRRLDDALSRVEGLRRRAFAYEDKPELDPSGFVSRTAASLADRSSYIVANELNLLPLDMEKYKKVRIVGMAPDEKVCIDFSRRLAEEFRKRGADAEVVRNWDNYLKDHRKETDRNYDLLIFASFYGVEHPTEMYRPDELSAHSALSFDRNKTVIISFGSPYMYKEYFETAETYINSDAAAITECVQAMCGEKPFMGIPSVKL